MRRTIAASLSAVAVVALAGCASTMVPKSTQHDDAAISSVVEASLAANDEVKARAVGVQTREGVVYLTGVVDTEEARREAGRVVWSTEGVARVMNEILVGRIDS